jgi:hypothetical protein
MADSAGQDVWRFAFPCAVAPRPCPRSSLHLSAGQVFGVLGAALLLIGIYTPALGGPLGQGKALFQMGRNGEGQCEALVVFALAVVSLWLATRRLCPVLAVTAMGCQLAVASAFLLQISTAVLPVPAASPSAPSRLPNFICYLRRTPITFCLGWCFLELGILLLFSASVLDDVRTMPSRWRKRLATGGGAFEVNTSD